MIKKHINSFFNSLSYKYQQTLIDVGDYQVDYADVNFVLLTHAHFDHIYGLNTLARHNGAFKVFTNDIGRQMLLSEKKNLSIYHDSPFTFEYPERIITVNDGDNVLLAPNIYAKAIFTPGHNDSCITWVIDDKVFSGDSFIPGIKTVTNLPGGNRTKAIESESLIKNLAIGRTLYPEKLAFNFSKSLLLGYLA